MNMHVMARDCIDSMDSVGQRNADLAVVFVGTKREVKFRSAAPRRDLVIAVGRTEIELDVCMRGHDRDEQHRIGLIEPIERGQSGP